jgi:hypothetical protein
VLIAVLLTEKIITATAAGGGGGLREFESLSPQALLVAGAAVVVTVEVVAAVVVRHLRARTAPDTPVFIPVVGTSWPGAWMAPGLGKKPPTTTGRVARIIARDDTSRRLGSGVLMAVVAPTPGSGLGPTGYVLTNQHVVADHGFTPTGVTVQVSAADGVIAMTGTVLPRPSPAHLADRLIATGAVRLARGDERVPANDEFHRDEVEVLADDIDLAIVRVQDPRLAKLDLRPLPLGDLPEPGSRMVMLGFPSTTIPTSAGSRGVQDIDTRAEHLVISGGRTAPSVASFMVPADVLGLPYDGNRWAASGNSGGPVILREIRVFGERRELLIGVTSHHAKGTGFGVAVNARGVRAFFGASGLDGVLRRGGRSGTVWGMSLLRFPRARLRE